MSKGYEFVYTCSPKLRETVPEDPTEAVQFMLNKVIRAVGDAKLLTVRLQGMKHQESLCYLPQ